MLKGRWRFYLFWGRWGNAGEVTLEEGDIFNIPTGMFRGFENIGTDYGMIMAILGGNDARRRRHLGAAGVIQDAMTTGWCSAPTAMLIRRQEGPDLARGRGVRCRSLYRRAS